MAKLLHPLGVNEVFSVFMDVGTAVSAGMVGFRVRGEEEGKCMVVG